jgi:hypothetical protein
MVLLVHPQQRVLDMSFGGQQRVPVRRIVMDIDFSWLVIY